jgi:hypothetical protein
MNYLGLIILKKDSINSAGSILKRYIRNFYYKIDNIRNPFFINTGIY